jgi:hypothetical protein
MNKVTHMYTNVTYYRADSRLKTRKLAFMIDNIIRSGMIFIRKRKGVERITIKIRIRLSDVHMSL